jgi:ABC-type transport system involved in cytochrome c biogenesis permease component
LTLLPIADRELRVSARNKATHRLRILFAVGGVTIGGGNIFFSMRSGGVPASQLGIWIFSVLKWIAFVFSCAAGIFLTSDCLSEEKREGTLGLLFLTDLRGYDVVLGKLLATSLRTFYSLLAIFPVMALSFVLGGVAADDFQHTLLSLCNTLFFSLALGMVISVISRDAHKAMTGTLGAMLVFLFLIPGLDSLPLGRNAGVARIGLLSPVFAFTHTSSYHAHDFWLSMLFVHLAGWSFLAIASGLAPKTWHEKGARPSLGTGWHFPLFGPAGRSSGRRLLDKNPICWIISRDRWASNLARLAILLVLGVFALSLASLSQSRGPATPASVAGATSTGPTPTISQNGTTTHTTHMFVLARGLTTNSQYRIANWCAHGLSLALEFWLAAHVCRFYIDGKRTGFLELLLVTPIRPADIFAGHWLALRRLFLAPIAAQLLLTLACGAIQVCAFFPAGVAGAPGVTGSSPASLRLLDIVNILVLWVGLGAISWCIELFTIVWFSIWMGITSKRINIAMLKTFWYAKVLPWFAGSFLLMFAFGSFFSVRAVWLWPVMFQGWFIGVDFALIALARRRAYVALSKWSDLTAA